MQWSRWTVASASPRPQLFAFRCWHNFHSLKSLGRPWRSVVTAGAVSLWIRIALVAATGALGTVARYLVGLIVLFVSRDVAMSFVATLIVNAVGSFLFGYFATLPVDVTWMTPALRLVILTGFLGGFTTFSAFAGDTLQLFHARGPMWAVSYVIAQNTLGLVLAAWGVHAGKVL